MMLVFQYRFQNTEQDCFSIFHKLKGNFWLKKVKAIFLM